MPWSGEKNHQSTDTLTFFRDMDIFKLISNILIPDRGWAISGHWKKRVSAIPFRIIITMNDGSTTNIISDIYIGKEYERGVSMMNKYFNVSDRLILENQSFVILEPKNSR